MVVCFFPFSVHVTTQAQLEKMENFPGLWSNFRLFLMYLFIQEVKISLQMAKFLGMTFPNSPFFEPCTQAVFLEF